MEEGGWVEVVNDEGDDKDSRMTVEDGMPLYDILMILHSEFKSIK
jgi:hypothetical protein